VSELGLESEILPIKPDHVASRNRYLYVKGRLHQMPSGLRAAFRTTPPFSRPIIQSVLKEILVRRGKAEDESVHAFVSRRLGSELADIAVDSICRGVFAGDSRLLSFRSCFPPLFEAERSRGSIFLGLLMGSEARPGIESSDLAMRAFIESWSQWSLKRGMQSLPEALVDSLSAQEQVELHHHAKVKSVNIDGGVWEIKLEDGASLKADHVISCLPASAHPLSEQLRSIATVTVAVVNLEYEGPILPVSGFGHLVPSSEDPALLGVVYDSVPFPEHNRRGGVTTRLTVMMGGAWFEQAFGCPDSVSEQMLLERAVKAVTSHLSLTSEPVWSFVAVLKNCIPQYHLGHWKTLEKMRQYISKHNLPLTLAGASYDGVSVNDVIFSGRTAAEGLVGKC
ncbi:hypothetical protein DNTS_028332, partial [Danionella cerebrum]